jgi:hypothetical protein
MAMHAIAALCFSASCVKILVQHTEIFTKDP